jgi:flagellar motility protein MotE (MotC chaperone)
LAAHTPCLLLRSSTAPDRCRLSDQLKVKEKVIDQQLREISSLKSNVAVLQRALQAKQSQVDGVQEKALQAIGWARRLIECDRARILGVWHRKIARVR